MSNFNKVSYGKHMAQIVYFYYENHFITAINHYCDYFEYVNTQIELSNKFHYISYHDVR